MAKLVLRGEKSPLQKTYELPLSKSISNRMLVLHFLYDTPLDKAHLSSANDTILLEYILTKPLADRINVEDAGTVMRYMTAVACTANKTTELHGTNRMHQRPIKGLTVALQNAGAKIEYLTEQGYPPIVVHPSSLTGNDWSVEANTSSQYVSALAMLMPYMAQDMQLRLIGDIVSKPYVLMTTSLMQKYGYEIDLDDDIIVYRETSKNTSKPYECPSDYSALAFPILELATGTGEIFIQELSTPDGLQGDERVIEFLPYLGISAHVVEGGLKLKKERFEVSLSKSLPIFDFNDIPDLALPMVSALCIHHSEVRVKGIETLNLKESERWEILQDIVYTLGCKVFPEDGYYVIKKVQDRFETLDLQDDHDHRVVMTLASLSPLFEKTIIYNPEVVKKSYPNYWEQFNA